MPPRMTQEQRRISTRRKILDAAENVLIEQGYANLTTTKVSMAAGVSQGALFRHFPSKIELMGAVAQDVYHTLAGEYESIFDTLEPGSDFIRESIRLLWKTFNAPRQMASYDLTFAARTDPALQARLEPVVRDHRQRIGRITHRVLSSAGISSKDFTALADLILMGIQGAAINHIAAADPDALEHRLNYIECLAKQLTRKSPKPHK